MSVQTCQDVVDLVTTYLEGELQPADRLAFERHVAICPPCRGYLSQIRVVIASAGSLKEQSLSEGVRSALVDSFREWSRDSER